MIDKQVYSIRQFCEAHNISRAKFYLLLNEGKAPRLMSVGRRRLISIESAADWRKMMETIASPALNDSLQLRKY